MRGAFPEEKIKRAREGGSNESRARASKTPEPEPTCSQTKQQTYKGGKRHCHLQPWVGTYTTQETHRNRGFLLQPRRKPPTAGQVL